MPSSTWVHTSTMGDIFWKYKPQSLLDIGVGAGRWGFLFREQMETFRGVFDKKDWKTNLIGVEIWPKYLKEYHEYFYDKIYVGDIRDFLKNNRESFDLIVAGDIIEHLEKSEALKVIEQLRMIANKCVVVCIPLGPGYPQGEVKGNKAEAHLSVWDAAEFKELGWIAEVIVKERIKKRPYGIFQLAPIKEVEFLV
jgi:SAM-dependent methyltransferase